MKKQPPIRCLVLGYLWKVAQAIHGSNNAELVAVGIEPQRARSPEAVNWLQSASIPSFDARKIKTNPEFDSISSSSIDLLVTAAFGQILPKELIDRFGGKILNVHTSLLPQYRGGTPIESQLLAGDTSGGVTLHWLDEGVDTGPIAIQREVMLRPDNDSYSDVYERYHDVAGDLMTKLLAIPFENWPHQAQHGAHRLIPPVKRESFKVDWNSEATKIRRMVLACGWREWVSCPLDAGELIILAADVVPDMGPHGQVLHGGEHPVIAARGGALILKNFRSPRPLQRGENLIQSAEK